MGYEYAEYETHANVPCHLWPNQGKGDRPAGHNERQKCVNVGHHLRFLSLYIFFMFLKYSSARLFHHFEPQLLKHDLQQ